MSVWSKTGSSAWSQINSLFVKTGSVTWTEMLGAWVKTGSTTWTRVFTKLLVPANTVLPDITGSTKLYGTLTGSLGSWTSPNGTNSYARQWQRASNSGGVAGAFSAISGATSSTYTTTDSDDNKFVCLRVTATNLSGSTTAQSYEYLITKYTPVALSTYSLSGVAIVGGTLSAFEQVGTWKGTTTITGDTSPSTFEYEWSWSDGTVRQSTAFNSTNSNTYTIVAGDLGKIIRVAVTGTNSGGSATTGYTSSGTVTSTYSFNFGNTLYVGSNGYIGLDSGGSTAASPGSGRIINIYSGDLVQYKLQEYSDSSNYYLYFRSYNYQSPLVRAAANAVDYQIKFYTDQAYCDIYIVRKGSSVPIQTQGPGYYSSGFTGYAGIPGPYFWGAGSVLRSYFNGTTGSQSALTWTAISDTVWKDITNADIDDSYTSVVTSADQSAPIPVNSVVPTLSTDTGNFSAGSVITVNSGTWNASTNSYTYNLLFDSTTPVATTSSTKTLNASNQYTITLADATNPSYYFRAKVTGYGGSGQTGASAIAYGVTSSRSYIDPTTTISVGTATATGFTVSGTAGPLNGIGTAYVSISKIEIFNSSYTSVASITTGLPSVNGTTGAWSYTWTGGSASTTYYAKVTAKSTDTAGTTYTTAFSTSIATSAGTVAPTSFTASTTYNDKITLDWSGGSGTSYEFYWGSTNTEVPGTNPASFTTTNTATYDWNAVRGSTYYLYIRAATGATKSSWFPTSAPGRTGYMPKYAPPTPTITNSATASASLSWYWDNPAPTSTQDYPSSWDYAQTTSSTSPTSGWTNLTTRPTSASPLVISSLSSSTDYYLHVKAKNADASTLATPLKATTDAPAATAPPAPGSPAVGASTLTRSLTTTLYRNSDTSKDQYWSADVKADFRVSWTASTGAASYEVYYNDTNVAPSASTSASYTGITDLYKDDYWYYGTSAKTYYYWVRARNTTGASAYVSCGSKAIPALSVTSFTIRIYVGGSTTTFSNPGNTYNYGGNTSGTPTLTNGYPWRSLTTRGNPNASTPTGVGHYAWAQGTVNGGTAIIATSSAV